MIGTKNKPRLGLRFVWDAWLGFVSSEGASQGLRWGRKDLTSSLSRRREWAKDGTSDGTRIEGRSRVPMKDKGSPAVCPDGATGPDPLLVSRKDEKPLQGHVKVTFAAKISSFLALSHPNIKGLSTDK